MVQSLSKNEEHHHEAIIGLRPWVLSMKVLLEVEEGKLGGEEGGEGGRKSASILRAEAQFY